MSWWKRQPAVPDPVKEAQALLRAFRMELGERYSLRDEDRRGAAEGLSRLGPASIPILIRAVADPLPNVRSTAATALGALRATEATPQLLGLLGDPEAGPRRAAIEALGQLGGPEAVAGLVGALGAGDSETRAAAAGALGAIGDGSAVEPLLAAAGDLDPDVGRAATDALARIRDPRAEAALVALTGHSRVEVRERAAKILRERGWRQDSPDERVASAILAGDFEAAAAEGAPALKPLLLVLAGPRERRPEAARALGRLGDPRATRRLTALLGNKDGVLAGAVERALVTIGPPAQEPVLARLADGRRETRASAARVLWEIGDETAAGPLLERILTAEWFQDGIRRETMESSYRETITMTNALAGVLSRAGGAMPRELLERIAVLEDLALTTDPAFGDPDIAGRTMLDRTSLESLREAARAEIAKRGAGS